MERRGSLEHNCEIQRHARPTCGLTKPALYSLKDTRRKYIMLFERCNLLLEVKSLQPPPKHSFAHTPLASNDDLHVILCTCPVELTPAEGNEHQMEHNSASSKKKGVVPPAKDTSKHVLYVPQEAVLTTEEGSPSDALHLVVLKMDAVRNPCRAGIRSSCA